MSLRSSATRYARALLDVALKEADAEKVERDLTSFAAMIESHPDLKQVMVSPRVTPEARRQIVENVARKGGAEMPVVKMLAMLAGSGRMVLLPDLIEIYRQRLLAHSNIVRGSVTSAVPLPAEKVKALENNLASVTGKQVQLDVTVDPRLIGGVVARIGSTVYDGSVRTQLQKMKQQLVENA